jgi:type IV pilus assembly protein PilW
MLIARTFAAVLGRPHRGLSMVELMVGIVVGLFVVGGALNLFVDYLTNNRRMLIETRVNQDLRAAADLIARDLRRGGYWRNAQLGVSTDPAVAPLTNPHKVVAYDATTRELTYSYAKDANNTLDAAEGFGVRRSTEACSTGGTARGVLQLRAANDWRTITDPCVMEIVAATDVSIVPVARTADLWSGCGCLLATTCTNADFAVGGTYYATRPQVQIRQYTITLKGQAVSDAKVKRELTETVRVRNDEIVGACPAV